MLSPNNMAVERFRFAPISRLHHKLIDSSESCQQRTSCSAAKGITATLAVTVFNGVLAL
jgi:hypothetical protein